MMFFDEGWVLISIRTWSIWVL